MRDDDRLNFTLPNVEFDDAEVCPKCLDTGVVVEEADGVRRARPCDCRRQEERTRRETAVGIPARYRECSLDNFRFFQGLTDVSAAAAHRLARSFADNYPAVDAGLLLMGPVGVGKTHLATGIIKYLSHEKGVRCHWCDFAELLAEVKKRYAGSSFDEYAVLAPLLDAEVLLIDDLGSMRIRDWTLDILSYVINQRYVRQRLIVATTNYLDEPGGADESLTDRIGPRLRSRLLEMCKTVLIAGQDFRAEQFQKYLLRDI